MGNPVPNRNNTDTVTILSGAALSDALPLYGRQITGLLMPAAWTAASVTLSVSLDGTTYVDLYDSSGEVTLTAAASVFIGLNVAPMFAPAYVKVRSGTSATPVNQAADRDIIVVTGDFIG